MQLFQMFIRVVSLLLVGFILTDPIPAWGQPASNVILIIADDLGVDELAIYGARPLQPVTPNIDRLAPAGVLFTNAWANPVCTPTRGSIYTGLHPFRHGAGHPFKSNLDLGQTTLAEAINLVGYNSGLFGKWHVGETSPIAGVPDSDYWPPQRGWNMHLGTLSGILNPGYCLWMKYTSNPFTGAYSTSPNTAYATKDCVDDAIRWINRQEITGNPWWATVAFNAPHDPFHEPNATHDGCVSGSILSDKEKYNRMIESMDYHIGRLLNSVEIPAEVLEKTIVIFIGDNGPPSDVVSASRQNKVKATVYRGGVAVPMIIADGRNLVASQIAPPAFSVVSPGRSHNALVHTTDLFSTIAEITTATAAAADSVTLVPYLSDTPHPATRAYNFSQSYHAAEQMATIWDGRFKLNYTSTAGYTMFDLLNDPDETCDMLIGACPSRPLKEFELKNALYQFDADDAGNAFP